MILLCDTTPVKASYDARARQKASREWSFLRIRLNTGSVTHAEWNIRFANPVMVLVLKPVYINPESITTSLVKIMLFLLRAFFVGQTVIWGTLWLWTLDQGFRYWVNYRHLAKSFFSFDNQLHCDVTAMFGFCGGCTPSTLRVWCERPVTELRQASGSRIQKVSSLINALKLTSVSTKNMWRICSTNPPMGLVSRSTDTLSRKASFVLLE